MQNMMDAVCKHDGRPLWRFVMPVVSLMLMASPASKAYMMPDGTYNNVFRVTDYGATGDGVTDDTSAFLATRDAVRDWMNSSAPNGTLPWHPQLPSMIYIPHGRYVVKDTIQLYPDDPPNCSGLSCIDWRILSIQVMGEGVGISTVIIPSNTTAFASAESPKALFVTHPPDDLFNNGQWLGYTDLTIEIEEGNAGAVAIRHHANNVGQIRNIEVLADPTSRAAVGIDFPIFLGGLTLFTNISISGCDIGVNVSKPQDILTIEGINIQNCNTGISLRDKGLGVRNLVCTNCSAGIITVGSSASLTLVDSIFSSDGGQAAVVSHGGQLFARNVSSTGFQHTIMDYANNKSSSVYKTVDGIVKEYSHSAPFRGFNTAPSTSTSIPIQETPTVPYPQSSSEWTVITLNGTVRDNSVVVQNAIDSGAHSIMLNGSTPAAVGNRYPIEQPIIIRKNLVRFHGGWLNLAYRSKNITYPAIRVDTPDHNIAVTVEASTLWGVQHNSDGQVLFRLIACGLAHESSVPCYQNSASGDGFLESVNFGGDLSAAAQTIGIRLGPVHQNLYARHLDIEGWENHIHNEGGSIWVFGMKLGETEGKPYVRSEGGEIELMSALLNSFSCQNGNASLYPCQAFHLINTDASLIGMYVTETGSYENATIIEEYKGSVNQILPTQFPQRFTWWPSSNHSLPPWLRVGYHLPFYRSALPMMGPTPPPVPPTPPPPPPPPPAPPTTPITPQCRSSLLKYCPGSENGGRACETCLHKYTPQLESGGCIPAKDGSFYNIISSWCGL